MGENNTGMGIEDRLNLKESNEPCPSCGRKRIIRAWRNWNIDPLNVWLLCENESTNLDCYGHGRKISIMEAEIMVMVSGL